MKKFLIISSLIFCASSFASPNPEAMDPMVKSPLVRVTIHKLENGQKKSSQSVTAHDGGSASTFTVSNNKKFVRNFYSPEILDNGKVLVRLNECSGTVTDEQLKNLSSVDCKPEIMNRKSFEASLNNATIVESIGAQGEKEEYYIFVEKVSNLNDATTL